MFRYKKYLILMMLGVFVPSSYSLSADLTKNKMEFDWDKGFYYHLKQDYANNKEKSYVNNKDFSELWMIVFNRDRYDSSLNDEFAWNEALETTKKEALNRIVLTDLSQVYTGHIGDTFYKYDFDKKGFALKTNDIRRIRVQVSTVNDYIYDTFNAFSSIFTAKKFSMKFPSEYIIELEGKYPDFLYMEKEQANNLIKSRKNRSGKIDRQFYIGVDFVLTSVGEKLPHSNGRKYEYGYKLKGEIKEVRYYLDRTFENPVVTMASQN